MPKKRELILCLVCAFLAFVFLRFMVFDVQVVRGGSMLPALAEGQIALILRRPFAGSPSAGNVVTTEHQGETIVKRVAARGPCVVFWDRDSFWTSKPEQPDTALITLSMNTGGAIVPASLSPGGRQPNQRALAENEVFLLGDNLSASVDSRSFGALPLEAITGRVLAVIYPFQAMGAVR